MKPDILLIGPLLDSVLVALESGYTVHRLYEAANPDTLIAKIADNTTAVVTDGGRGVEASILERLPKVKIVTVFGVGVDAVDLDYCKKNGIAVTNTPDVLSGDVADLAVALMLAVSRKIVESDNYVRAGQWVTHGSMPLTTRMFGRTAGIIGMGSIGVEIAKRLEGFDMDVVYCNRNKRSDVSSRYYDSAVNMARDVDYLIVAASASDSTYKMVNADVLSALGSDGYLINISRGTLVDQDALIQALDNNTIKGAGLDVFVDEPNVPQALINMKNVVLQPHQASATLDTRKAMGKLVTDNLSRFFSGRPLVTQYSR